MFAHNSMLQNTSIRDEDIAASQQSEMHREHRTTGMSYIVHSGQVLIKKFKFFKNMSDLNFCERGINNDFSFVTAG